jgi:hypothetical protein
MKPILLAALLAVAALPALAEPAQRRTAGPALATAETAARPEPLGSRLRPRPAPLNATLSTHRFAGAPRRD